MNMLVLFLILFTNVLADSEEGNYVDLLPDAEKREFIERVARRILKDVQSQEDKNNAKSGEMPDDDLKKHDEYVKSILKEEAENVRRSKGENVKDISDEKGSLDVKPLGNEKMGTLEEPDLDQLDLTLRNDRRDIGLEDENSKDFIKVEIVTDEVPIIKRSVQEDHAKKSDENTAEILERVQPGKNVNNPEVGVRRSSNAESEVEAILVKGIEEPLARRSNDEDKPPETTKSTVETTSVAENTSVILTSNHSDANNVTSDNVDVTANSSITEDDVLQSTSTKTSDNEEVTTVKSNITENNTTKSTLTTTTTPATSTSTEFPTTEASTTAKEAPTITTETETTEEVTTETTEEELDTTTELSTTLTSTMVDEGTTETVTESTTVKPKTKLKTTTVKPKPKPTTTESTVVTDSPEATTHGIFIPLTEGIVVEEFTSAPKKEPLIIKNVIKKRKINIKHSALNVKVPKAIKNKNIEGKTKPKLIYHKLEKYIVGPKGKKKKDASSNNNFIELEKVYYDNNYKVKKGKEYQVYEIPADKSPFVLNEDTAAEQPYYVPIYTYSAANAYFNPQNRLGPNTNDESPEKGSPFNVDDSDAPQLNTILNSPIDMEYSESAFDIQRKKFGGQQQTYHNIYKQPQYVPPIKKRLKPNHGDYLDSDYYYGRISIDERRANKEGSLNFPNSNENDHPAHSMSEGNLKDHVRAVRNILFHQKSFGLLEKDKYGDPVRTNMKLSEPKHEKKHHILRISDNEDEYSKKEHDNSKGKNKDPENNIAIDYYFGRENKEQDHIQKVGYLKDNNSTKELFVMDDDFKAKVMKYMDDLKAKKENAELQPATPLPQPGKVIDVSVTQADQILIEQEKIRSANLMINSEKNDKQDLRVEVEPVPIPDTNKGENDENTENEEVKFKLNNRRNDDVRVSVYLKVLKDMITSNDNNALKQYDWLGTTVDVQSGLQKLFELTALVNKNEKVHPADMEILKYVLFLHKLSTEILEANDFGVQLRKKLLPKNKNKKRNKSKLLKQKGLINRVWLYLRREVPEINENGALKSLNKFLMNIEDALFDLHDAVKHIAKITKYKKQHWYKDLKDLYINTDDKHLLEILLHMSVLRFFTLLEENTKNGLEHDYIEYMKDNKKDSKKTLEEMMFIMQVLADYNKFVK